MWTCTPGLHSPIAELLTSPANVTSNMHKHPNFICSLQAVASFVWLWGICKGHLAAVFDNSALFCPAFLLKNGSYLQSNLWKCEYDTQSKCNHCLNIHACSRPAKINSSCKHIHFSEIHDTKIFFFQRLGNTMAFAFPLLLWLMWPNLPPCDRANSMCHHHLIELVTTHSKYFKRKNLIAWWADFCKLA